MVDFLALPREIRDEIYYHALLPNNFIEFPFRAMVPDVPAPMQLCGETIRGKDTRDAYELELTCLSHEYRYWCSLSPHERLPFNGWGRNIKTSLVSTNRQVHDEGWETIHKMATLCISNEALRSLHRFDYRVPILEILLWMCKFQNIVLLAPQTVSERTLPVIRFIRQGQMRHRRGRNPQFRVHHMSKRCQRPANILTSVSPGGQQCLTHYPAPDEKPSKHYRSVEGSWSLECDLDLSLRVECDTLSIEKLEPCNAKTPNGKVPLLSRGDIHSRLLPFMCIKVRVGAVPHMFIESMIILGGPIKINRTTEMEMLWFDKMSEKYMKDLKDFASPGEWIEAVHEGDKKEKAKTPEPPTEVSYTRDELIFMFFGSFSGMKGVSTDKIKAVLEARPWA